MNQEDCIRLIQVYRGYRFLWDANHKSYHNKIKREDAWKEMSLKMGQTVGTLKAKMKILMGSYRSEKSREKKRRVTGSGSDDAYESKWFAYKYFDFLSDKDNPQETRDTEVEIPEKEITHQVDEEDPSDDSTNPSTSSSRRFSPSTREKRLQDITAIKRKMEETLATFQTDTKASNRKQELHECDLYGQLLAKRLKRFDEKIRDSIMHQIDNIMYQAKQKHINPITRSP